MRDSVEIARVVEFGEARALADFYAMTPPDFAAQFGIGLRRLGPAYVFTAAAFDILLFNRVMGLGLGEPATESQLDAVLAHYAAAGVKNFGIPLSPSAQPAGLPAWLAARGLHARSSWVKMIRAPEPPANIRTELRLELAGRAQAEVLGEIAAVAFSLPPPVQSWLILTVGRPGWRHYLAYAGDRAVACGALYVADRIGWLGLGATLPEARGRGAQGALMVRRIRDAIAAGCEWTVTETGEETPGQPNPSYHNMVRTGFSLAYPRPNYGASSSL